MDYLLTAIANLLTRIEATLGGTPPEISGRLIEWGKNAEELDGDSLIKALSGLGKR